MMLLESFAIFGTKITIRKIRQPFESDRTKTDFAPSLFSYLRWVAVRKKSLPCSKLPFLIPPLQPEQAIII